MKLKESLMSRRAFINGCLAGTGTGVVGTVAYTLVSALIPSAENDDPVEIKIPLNGVTRVPNSAQLFFFGRTPALLILSAQEEFIALKAICTHFECAVHYDADHQKIVCPCHKGFFDIHGNPLEGPPPRPLMRYLISREEHHLIIRQENPA